MQGATIGACGDFNHCHRCTVACL